jgi:hypothetical protein
LRSIRTPTLIFTRSIRWAACFCYNSFIWIVLQPQFCMVTDIIAFSSTEPVSSHCNWGLLAPSKQREIWEGWLVSFFFFKHYKVMIFRQCLLTVKSHVALAKAFYVYFNPYPIYGYLSVLIRSLIYFGFFDVKVSSWSWWCVPCFEQQRETWLIAGSGKKKLHYSCLSIWQLSEVVQKPILSLCFL